MNDFENLEFFVMPKDQGQIVECSYALFQNFLYKKVLDKSDQSKKFFRAELFENSDIEFEPQNNQLPDHGEWDQYGRFEIYDDCCRETIDATDMECAVDWATEYWQEGNWDTKCLIKLTIEHIGWDDEILDYETIEVECGEDPVAPDCVDEQEHDWCSPHDIVGGLKENPGIWSTGGTTIVSIEVCSHCGCKKRTVNYGSQRNQGQCDTIEYYYSDE